MRKVIIKEVAADGTKITIANKHLFLSFRKGNTLLGIENIGNINAETIELFLSDYGNPIAVLENVAEEDIRRSNTYDVEQELGVNKYDKALVAIFQ